MFKLLFLECANPLQVIQLSPTVTNCHQLPPTITNRRRVIQSDDQWLAAAVDQHGLTCHP